MRSQQTRPADGSPGPAADRAVDRTQATVLRVRGLHKRFGTAMVLDGLDLDVQADELVALVGENGVGKSTLVRCVAGGLDVDGGQVHLLGRPVPDGRVPAPDVVDVVWQDLALCENLGVVDNLFLGREPSWLLPRTADRQVRARQLLAALGIDLPDLSRPVADLSGGQRQSVALARALLGQPRLLILDEPTASLDPRGDEAVTTLIRRMRAAGTAILLVSHDLDLVCRLADRVVVLRNGRITAQLTRPDLSSDALRAHISGLADDALARRQIHALRSLVDQLAEVDSGAVLPMVLTAVSVALGQPRVALHLRHDDGPAPRLHLAAALGLDGGPRGAMAELDADGHGPFARAMAERTPVVVPDMRRHADAPTASLVSMGIRSLWVVPLVGGTDVLGTLSGYGDARGPISEGAIELATLYASHAAAALDHERLLAAVTRRNRTLETLRRMLETLAGPEADDAGLVIALEALRVGLGADVLVLLEEQPVAGGTPTRHVRLATGAGDATWAAAVALPRIGEGVSTVDGAGRTILATSVEERADRRALVARWAAGEAPRAGAVELLVDGAHSVLLALERRAHEAARREAATLRRSTELQRTFLARLSHELRTPLTAIHGYADSLRQPDVTWDDTTTHRFLDTIARESDRLGQLVSALLDASAIEAGVLHLQPDWCELPLVVEAAVACVPVADPSRVVVDVPSDLTPIRADHDRLEQALVNLIGNAVAHTPPGTTTTVSAIQRVPDHIELVVADDGPGLPDRVAGALFVPGVRGPSANVGAGLGLTICHGIVRAHGGTIELDTGPLGTRFVLTLPVDGPTADSPGWTFHPTALVVPDLHGADQ